MTGGECAAHPGTGQQAVHRPASDGPGADDRGRGPAGRGVQGGGVVRAQRPAGGGAADPGPDPGRGPRPGLAAEHQGQGAVAVAGVRGRAGDAAGAPPAPGRPGLPAAPRRGGAGSGVPGRGGGRPAGPCPFPVVTVDDRQGVAGTVAHLLGLGHLRVGFVGGPQGYVHSRSRRAAWRQTLEAAGVAPGPELVADFTGPGGAAATRALLELADPPTAIVYANDAMAIAGMGVAIGLGLEVPGDLSVAGFDDVPLAAHVAPPLTTVRQDAMAWGRAAAEVLLAVSEGREGRPTADGQLPPATPVFRASTCPPRPECDDPSSRRSRCPVPAYG